MSEQKSMWSLSIACLLGAFVLWKGLVRGTQNGSNTWIEMLNVVKDGVFWVFMAIFTVVIFAAIISIFAVTFEKLRAAFVNWFKSEEWCEEVDKTLDAQRQEIAELKERCRELELMNKKVTNNLIDLYRKDVELRAFTGIDIKRTEAKAEEEVLEGV